VYVNVPVRYTITPEMVIVPVVLNVKLLVIIPAPDNVPVPVIIKRHVPLTVLGLDTLQDRFPVIEIWFPCTPRPKVPLGKSTFAKVKFCGTLKPPLLLTVKVAVVVIKLLPPNVNDKVPDEGMFREVDIVKLFDSVIVPDADICHQVMPLVANVHVPKTNVELVVTTVPAVYVNVPVLKFTMPDMVNVPGVLMIILFVMIPVLPDQVPVPLNVIIDVPETVTDPTPRLLVFIVFPVRVTVEVLLSDNVPPIFKLLESVNVRFAPENITLFQDIPLVSKVVDVLQFNVELVVMTVPAVYVIVPVL